MSHLIDCRYVQKRSGGVMRVQQSVNSGSQVSITLASFLQKGLTFFGVCDFHCGFENDSFVHGDKTLTVGPFF